MVDPGRGSRLLVRVGAELVDLEAEEVLEILEWVEPARLPGAPAEIGGIVNHRGSPVTVVNLGVALGVSAGEMKAGCRLVVVRWKGERIALAVDDVLALGGVSDSPIPDRLLDLESLFQSIF
jgi:chemotaxis signal transduction protein